MEAQAFMDLNKQLCFAVYACSREITKLYRPLLDPLGLTYTQYVTLLALWGEGRMKVKDLGLALYLDSGTLTPLLKKLEGMGIVRRARDTLDERNVWIEVTEEGWKLRDKAVHVPVQAFCMSGISQEEGDALHRQLHALLKQLHAIAPSSSGQEQ
ncbi:MAG: ohrR [Paenibacillaceae bacterium]|nr:ohrR [Paenibacillaceae bacterium]